MVNFVAERFAPVRRELSEYGLAVRGTIPAWLDGRYVRNGPNPVAEVVHDEYNWFTGDGMVHGVRLCDGNAVWYRNRWVDSEVTSRLLHRAAPNERGRSALRGFRSRSMASSSSVNDCPRLDCTMRSMTERRTWKAGTLPALALTR